MKLSASPTGTVRTDRIVQRIRAGILSPRAIERLQRARAGAKPRAEGTDRRSRRRSPSADSK